MSCSFAIKDYYSDLSFTDKSSITVPLYSLGWRPYLGLKILEKLTLPPISWADSSSQYVWSLIYKSRLAFCLPFHNFFLCNSYYSTFYFTVPLHSLIHTQSHSICRHSSSLHLLHLPTIPCSPFKLNTNVSFPTNFRWLSFSDWKVYVFITK